MASSPSPPLRPERREVLLSMAMTSSGALASAPTHATKRSKEGMGVERSEDVAQAVVARRAVREGQTALHPEAILQAVDQTGNEIVPGGDVPIFVVVGKDAASVVCDCAG